MRVHCQVIEGQRGAPGVRGIVLSAARGVRGTFTVRKQSVRRRSGADLPGSSPKSSARVMAIGDVRRAKLYDLRGGGQEGRVREKQQQRGAGASGRSSTATVAEPAEPSRRLPPRGGATVVAWPGEDAAREGGPPKAEGKTFHRGRSAAGLSSARASEQRPRSFVRTTAGAHYVAGVERRPGTLSRGRASSRACARLDACATIAFATLAHERLEAVRQETHELFRGSSVARRRSPCGSTRRARSTERFTLETAACARVSLRSRLRRDLRVTLPPRPPRAAGSRHCDGNEERRDRGGVDHREGRARPAMPAWTRSSALRVPRMLDTRRTTMGRSCARALANPALVQALC